MFDRIISVDWSGAATENDGVDLRVATFDALTGISTILDRPYGRPRIRSWTRAIFRRWIIEQLNPKAPPTIVAMDFGFGLPWGSDQAVFGVNGWRAMIRTIAEMYELNNTARATAQAVNDTERFEGHGPYRFDENRNDFRFYIGNGVAYYRLAELVVPQANSQWNLCKSKGAVGFHSINGVAMLDYLIQLRDDRTIDFVIWPQELNQPDGKKHCLVESYPAICPILCCPGCQTPYLPRSSDGPYLPRRCTNCLELGGWRDGHQEDAWKVLQMLVTKNLNGSLPELFEILEQDFGRISNVNFQTQIGFEGWIIGLNGGAQ